jgi:hypothetical protein
MLRRTAPLALALALMASACDSATPVIESTTRLDSTADSVGPYVVNSVIIGADDDLVQLYYLIDDAPTFVPVVMERGGERYHAAIPGQASGTEIAYYVAVSRDGTRLVSDPDGAGAEPYVFTIE